MDNDPELIAMAAVSAALAPLDQETRLRVLTWASDRYLDTPAKPTRARPATPPPFDQVTTAQTFSEFFAEFSPSSEKEKALLGAYWLQEVEGKPEFGSAQVNEILRDTGHKASNITTALQRNIDEKPQKIVQLKKSGTSKQSRKIYKMTTAGIAAIKKMASIEESDET